MKLRLWCVFVLCRVYCSCTCLCERVSNNDKANPTGRMHHDVNDAAVDGGGVQTEYNDRSDAWKVRVNAPSESWSTWNWHISVSCSVSEPPSLPFTVLCFPCPFIPPEKLSSMKVFPALLASLERLHFVKDDPFVSHHRCHHHLSHAAAAVNPPPPPISV